MSSSTSSRAAPTHPQPYSSVSTPPNTGTVLTLSFFPATLSANTVTVWSGLYTTPEAAAEIERAHEGLVTWRDPDDGTRLYVWHPTAVGAPPKGFSRVTVRLAESPRLFERMIEDAVFRRLRELGFETKGEGWVNYRKPSLLAQVPVLASAVKEDIGIYPKIIAEVFFSKKPNGELLIGLVVDVLYTTRMQISAAEWKAAGLEHELLRTYVNLLPNTPEADRLPDLVGRCVGRIDGLRGETAILSDLRDRRLAAAALASIAPEPTRANLARYLGARYERAFAAGEKALTTQLRELVRPKSRHKFARGLVVERLQPSDTPYADDGLIIVPGVTVRFSDMATTGPDTFPVRRLVDPEYSFDGAGRKHDRKVDQGL